MNLQAPGRSQQREYAMGWILSGLNSISGWLAPAPEPVAATQEQFEAVRDAMLHALGDTPCPRHPRLAPRIRVATELETLWYMRSPLMDALSHLRGEPVAVAELSRITALFEALPGGVWHAGRRRHVRPARAAATIAQS